MTNGDMITALFPKSRIYKLKNFVQFWYTENEDGRYVNFRRDWWDLSYNNTDTVSEQYSHDFDVVTIPPNYVPVEVAETYVIYRDLQTKDEIRVDDNQLYTFDYLI